MNIITLILPIIAMASMFLYMLQGCIWGGVTLSFIPFILGVIIFVVDLVLLSKIKKPEEALAEKTRNIRCFFSLAMGIICFIALLFPQFIYVETYYDTVTVENGFILMSFNSYILEGSFLGVILGLLCWMQFFISIATIIISIVAIFKFPNKTMNIITLILPIIAMASMLLYMLLSSITCIVFFAVDETEVVTLSFIPFILGVIIFVVGLVLRSKIKIPVEEKRYQQAMNYGMTDENINYADTANVAGGENRSNVNDGELLSEAQIQMYLMSIKSNVPNESLFLLSQQLHKVSQSKMSQLTYLPMKSSTTILLISIFLGGFGVDRFMLGDIGIGVCKLLFGVFTFGIWPLIDIFMCYKKAKEKNLDDLMTCLTNNRI